MTFTDQRIAKMRTEKSCSAGHENAHLRIDAYIPWCAVSFSRDLHGLINTD
jgi:hypothetical protein